MKKYVALLPFRAMLKFFYLYVWNLGFLDGQAGLRYSLLQSIYEYMIVLKIDELHRKKKDYRSDSFRSEPDSPYHV